MKKLKYVPISNPNPERVTKEQVCRLLKISAKRFKELNDENKLTIKYAKVGKCFYERAQVEALLNELINNNTI